MLRVETTPRRVKTTHVDSNPKGRVEVTHTQKKV
jgi:hypothetical protein